MSSPAAPPPPPPALPGAGPAGPNSPSEKFSSSPPGPPRQLDDPESSSEMDLRMLGEGRFSDFTVVCGEKEWKTHQVILVRCPFFDGALAKKSGFKEITNSRMTIGGFEPYEVSWLLQFIYGSDLDIEVAKSESPHKSFLETCSLLWSIGDYFCYKPLADHALSKLKGRARELFFQSGHVSEMMNGISFLPDIEAGIRAAWRDDRAPGKEVRTCLIHLCIGLTPYLRDAESFTKLLDEVPEFSPHFVKALLGCPGENRFRTYDSPGGTCPNCNTYLSAPRWAPFSENMYYRPTTLLEFYGGKGAFFCSQWCYQSWTLANGLAFPM